MQRFEIKYWFEAVASEIIEAEDGVKAQEIAEHKSAHPDFFMVPEQLFDVSVRVVHLHPVVRFGEKIWTDQVLSFDRPGH